MHQIFYIKIAIAARCNLVIFFFFSRITEIWTMNEARITILAFLEHYNTRAPVFQCQCNTQYFNPIHWINVSINVHTLCSDTIVWYCSFSTAVLQYQYQGLCIVLQYKTARLVHPYEALFK
jgi:hypothetical protein